MESSMPIAAAERSLTEGDLNAIVSKIEETQTKLNGIEHATDRNSGNIMPTSLSNDLQKLI